jgi:uncharacterized protein (TIGR02452 family)
MGREENAEIFRDTDRLCRTNERLKNGVQKSTQNQKLILEDDKLEKPELKVYENSAKVTVSKKRSLDAASAYKGQRVAVHNFASASNPGGGVVNGATAQEECLCRCSGLYFNLDTPAMWNGFYKPHRMAHDPIHNDDIIYTPGVIVFKSDDASPTLMPEESWYEVDVITCAAPNLRERPSNSYNSGDGAKSVKVTDEKLGEIHEKRLRRILDVAVSEGDDTVILGAFGCGAFQNNPRVVAQSARNVIGDYLYAFKNIEFAVYCSPRDERNFEIFDRIMKGMN